MSVLPFALIAALLAAPAPPQGASLANRPEAPGVSAAAGGWVQPWRGSLSGRWLLLHDGDHVTLSGRGYFRVRYEIEYWRGMGRLPPRRFEVQGRLVHVASGGGRRIDTPYPGEPGRSLMGRPGVGYVVAAPGEELPWINEYYWLDGTATLRLHEGGGLAPTNYAVSPVTRADIEADLARDPARQNPRRLWVRRGEVRDPGD